MSDQTETKKTGGLRAAMSGTAGITFLSIVLALIIGAVFIVLSDPAVQEASSYLFAAPMDTISAAWTAVFEAYKALLTGMIFNPAKLSSEGLVGALKPLSETITMATPLILGGLSVALAFRAGLFNIGAEGQIILGAIFASFIGFQFDMPLIIHLPLAVLGALIGGALWGGIAGFLKAKTGAHEVITTIMLNWIAIYLVAWLLTKPAFLREGRQDPISPPVNPGAEYPTIIDQWRVHAGIIVAILAAWFVSWLLNRSTLGFQFRAVGANSSAARTAGMNVSRMYLLVMLIAGGLSGLAGSAQVLGTEKSLTGGISAGIGFDAITVALLGRGNPWGVVAAGLLFGGLRAGGLNMQTATGTPIDIVLVIQALIVLFIAAPPLVRSIFRLPETGSAGFMQTAKGWNG
ncbi:MAG: ABC transporter permease [Candidatus Nanopelagicales bacterium]|jgi:simple sugar transport system permease protein|nr:ABC transporter permease [Candidatus Nanopelagicales bacterium]MCU0297912.1 ABC transporter permease [Candidatus Nanopelagicales bacterium]